MAAEDHFQDRSPCVEMYPWRRSCPSTATLRFRWKMIEVVHGHGLHQLAASCIHLPREYGQNGDNPKRRQAKRNGFTINARNISACKPRAVQPFLVAVLTFAVLVGRRFGHAFCRRFGMSPF